MIDDPARPVRNAAALGRQLVANTAVQLEIITLESGGDRRDVVRDGLAPHDGGIVVMDVHGGGFLGDLLIDEEAEEVLQFAGLPLIAIGPSATVPASICTLAVAADEHTPLDRPLDLAARWSASLGPVSVVINHLDPPMSWPRAAHDDHGRSRTALTDRGLSGVVQSISTIDPWKALRDAASSRRDAVTVVTTRRWPGLDHWFSTARALILHAPSPVLVVPF